MSSYQKIFVEAAKGLLSEKSEEKFEKHATSLNWSNNFQSLEILKISGVMECNIFEEIKRFLHFNNSQQIPQRQQGYEKLFKIRPLLNQIR